MPGHANRAKTLRATMIAACTIVGRTALAHARVTAASFREHNPGVPFYALLADDPAGLFDPAAEPFMALTLAELAVPGVDRLRFRYAQPELSYVLTPWLLTHLLGRGFERVLFLKQETLVVGPLQTLFDRLEKAAILLTPHLYEPLDGPSIPTGPTDPRAPSAPDGRATLVDQARREREILLAGVYNAGVLGVATSPTSGEAQRFLSWWSARLARHSLRAVEAGMHFEQRWLDFVPAYFRGAVAIDSRPGSNLGHWRFPESIVEESAEGPPWAGDTGTFRVGGDLLRVARFSGYEPEQPEFLTCHNSRVRVAELGGAGRRLVASYHARLERSDHAVARRWPSGSSRFDDGAEIPATLRTLYRGMSDEAVAPFSDPHRTGRGSYRAWLAERLPRPWRMARLWKELWADRRDLQSAFPAPEAGDRSAYLRWIDEHGRAESGLADAGWLGSGSWRW